MKPILTAVILFSALLTLAGVAAVADGTSGQKACPSWEVPIAAGVWYPGDGDLPEKPMRYYRARCFPGCHVGSGYGMFPDTPLEDDRPIFPTSTIDRVADESVKKN